VLVCACVWLKTSAEARHAARVNLSAPSRPAAPHTTARAALSSSRSISNSPKVRLCGCPDFADPLDAVEVGEARYFVLEPSSGSAGRNGRYVAASGAGVWSASRGQLRRTCGQDGCDADGPFGGCVISFCREGSVRRLRLPVRVAWVPSVARSRGERATLSKSASRATPTCTGHRLTSPPGKAHTSPCGGSTRTRQDPGTQPRLCRTGQGLPLRVGKRR
jgi:hypothetical protein